MRYFATSDRLISQIANIPFENMTPRQRNRVRILNMYFSKPETYHQGVIDEIKEECNELNIQISDPQVLNDVTYYTLSSEQTADDTEKPPTREQMIKMIIAHLPFDEAFVDSWPDGHIHIAYENLNKKNASKHRSKRNVVGYLLVDKTEQVVRFKATTDSIEKVIEQFNVVVEKELANTTSD